MSDKKSVDQLLRFQRKLKTNMAGAKPVTGKKMREVTKQQRVPALGRIGDKVYTTEGLEKKAVFQVGLNIKVSTKFNCIEPINSEHIERLEPESVRVKQIPEIKSHTYRTEFRF